MCVTNGSTWLRLAYCIAPGMIIPSTSPSHGGINSGTREEPYSTHAVPSLYVFKQSCAIAYTHTTIGIYSHNQRERVCALCQCYVCLKCNH